MITYQNLDWKTLDFLKAYLFRRLTIPLHQTIGSLERAHLLVDEGLAANKLTETQYQMEGMLNLINAWGMLITYKHSGPLSAFQFKEFTPEKLPAWFKAAIERQTALRVDFKVPILVHLETFLEGILLLYHVGTMIGEVSSIQLIDAPLSKPGVYLRVVFATKEDQVPYIGLDDIEAHFHPENPADWDNLIQFVVARDLLALNNAQFTLQNNKKTGQQAFAAYFEPHGKYAESINQTLESKEAPDPAKVMDLIPTKTDEELLRENLKRLLAHFGNESTNDQQNLINAVMGRSEAADTHAERSEGEQAGDSKTDAVNGDKAG